MEISSTRARRLTRADISGPNPALLQKVGVPASSYRAILTASHGGQAVAYSAFEADHLLSGADLNVRLATMILGSFAGPIAFSADDSLVFESLSPTTTVTPPSSIGVFSAKTGRRLPDHNSIKGVIALAYCR